MFLTGRRWQSDISSLWVTLGESSSWYDWCLVILLGPVAEPAFQEFDLRNTQSIEESVRHSDIVYNLIGRQYPTKYAIDSHGPNARMFILVTGTSAMPTSISKAQNESPKQSQNMMSTALFMYHPTMPTPTPNRSSSKQR